MKLAEYLDTKKTKPSVFASELRVPASTITRLLRGERSRGIGLIALIHDKTHGAVTANDFLPERAA